MHFDWPRAARFAVVAAGAALVLWALFAGVRAVYRATMTSPSQEAPGAVRQEVPASADDAPGQADSGPRTPQPIPPLYID